MKLLSMERLKPQRHYQGTTKAMFLALWCGVLLILGCVLRADAKIGPTRAISEGGSRHNNNWAVLVRVALLPVIFTPI